MGPAEVVIDKAGVVILEGGKVAKLLLESSEIIKPVSIKSMTVS